MTTGSARQSLALPKAGILHLFVLFFAVKLIASNSTTKVVMKIARPIFTWLLFAGLISPAFGAGYTNPDGTVSPFPPGFFGLGTIEPFEASEATGVAAKDGVLFAVSAFVTGAPAGSGVGRMACFYTPGTPRLVALPGPGEFSTTSALSGNGAIKVGEAGGAYIWNNNDGNQGQALTGERALAISADGSTVVGQSGKIAALWTLPTGARTLLDPPAGYDSAVAQGVSANGQIICGRAFNSAEAIAAGAANHTHAFRQVRGAAAQDLGVSSGFNSSIALGISADGSKVVGASAEGGGGFVWSLEDGMMVLSDHVDDEGFTSAYAISADGKVYVGTANKGEASLAILWTDSGGHLADPIQSSLIARGVSGVAGWRLSYATGISQDGYTICGVGINPSNSKTEGWVATLPPILRPPTIGVIDQASAYLDKPFSKQIEGSFLPGDSFSAKNLPEGFQIDSMTGKITGTWQNVLNPSSGAYTVTVFATRAGQGTSSRSFSLYLSPPTSVKSLIQGQSFLPNAKPPGETVFQSSFGRGLSGDGRVAVGREGQANDSKAYRWSSSGGIEALPRLDGAVRTYSTAEAASANGKVIVGQAAIPPREDGSERIAAVVWNVMENTPNHTTNSASQNDVDTDDTSAEIVSVTNLGFFPGGDVSIANGVSADGTVVVGYSDEDDPTVNYQIFEAFRWTAATGMVGLGWLPGGNKASQAEDISADGSVIVGASTSAAGSQAFRWTAADGMTGLGLPSGAAFGRAAGVSADNSTIIGFNSFSNLNRAFRWTAAEGMVDLGLMPGMNFSQATGVSADGSVIVGRTGVEFQFSRAFLWDAAHGMRSLLDVLVEGNPNLTGWNLQSAQSISADGKTVVGFGINPNGDMEGFTAYLEVKPPQLLNIATRMRVQTGENVLIGGFIITGSEPKKVIIRGIGPSLSSFFSGALADPTLELHQGNTTIASNDNWKEHEAEVAATTIPPSQDLESAIVTTLTPGNYTAILSDKNGESGVGVVEVYDLAQAANSQLANISSRGFVDTGDSVMIGGLIVGGGSAVGTGRVLVRAIGPSLESAGVTGALQDPTLELFDSSGTSLASNDNWMTTQKAEIEATTIPPTDDRESALLATLPAGSYTAIVRGSNNATGVAVVEVYNLQ